MSAQRKSKWEPVLGDRVVFFNQGHKLKGSIHNQVSFNIWTVLVGDTSYDVYRRDMRRLVSRSMLKQRMNSVYGKFAEKPVWEGSVCVGELSEILLAHRVSELTTLNFNEKVRIKIYKEGF